ncbi:MAG: type I glyceraldehyde-3-phosphate dehydrogenase [Bacteroidota bacterium]
MKKIRVAINGFGRIGRITYRAMAGNDHMELVAVNDLSCAATLGHLFKYDSIHRTFEGDVSWGDDFLMIDGKKISVLKEPDPGRLPWKELGVDVVIESTGLFVKKEEAIRHVSESGARKVIISAPAKGESDGVPYVVLGVNDHVINKEDVIISNSSCTTNNVAPLIMILDKLWGIEKGFITTVHSYTRDQNLLDAPHKDLRRARAAAYSIVPTTTGAAKAATKIFPHLENNLGGAGIRVPVPDGSLTDLTCTLAKPTSVEEINRVFSEAAETYLKGILEYTEDPIVSIDIVGNPHSSIFDAKSTMSIGKNMIKVLSWYDNEFGYAGRMVDMLKLIGK